MDYLLDYIVYYVFKFNTEYFGNKIFLYYQIIVAKTSIIRMVKLKCTLILNLAIIKILQNCFLYVKY